MQITKPGQYITRSGAIAHVLAIIDCDYEPVIGYIMKETENGATYPLVLSWSSYGTRYLTIDDQDDIVSEV